jgi:hypothetical protein
MKKLSNIPGKFARHRILSLLILFLLLVGLCIYYNENFMMHQDYASQGAIMKNYPQGNLVVVSGSITKTFPDSFQLRDNYNNFTIISSHKVSIGDRAEVYGLLSTDYQIDAKQINITPLWSYQFVIIRSLIAFLFLAFIFNRYWKLNPEKGLFQRRSQKK